MDLRGKFIVVDGPDGSGKTTQLARLRDWISSLGLTAVLSKDPGGTEVGERIRRVLLSYDLASMDARCEALLFMASRAQLVAEVVRPALRRGDTVLCDRFISATCAYQAAVGVPREVILDLGRLAVGDTWPDLTLVLDLPVELGFQRTGRTPQRAGRRARDDHAEQIQMFDGARLDAMERRPLEFHRAVRANFLELPTYYPRPVVVIDAGREPEAVFASLQDALRARLP
jgi:dTMP kinase